MSTTEDEPTTFYAMILLSVSRKEFEKVPFIREEEVTHEDELRLLPPNQTHHKRKRTHKIKLEEVETILPCVKKERKKRKVMEEDDSEETLKNMLEWKVSKPDNRPPFDREFKVVGVCSEPIKKQMTESDVKEDQCRLMLKKIQVEQMMLQVMEKSKRLGTNGLDVLVYGPDGEVHKMKLKMWNGKTPVLTSTGWKKFVKDYDLKMHCDFLTIWMFRHKETHEICFAIDFTRFHDLDKPLSKRILKLVF